MTETQTSPATSDTTTEDTSTMTSDTTSGTNVVDETPDFAALTPNPMGRVWLEQVWAAHLVYVDSFDKVYPTVDSLPRAKAWRDSLPTVSAVDVPDRDSLQTDDGTVDTLTLLELANVARLSRDASHVATVLRAVQQVADKARENLDGLYVHAKSTRTPTVETADAASVEAARLQLSNLLKMAAQMTAAGCITDGLHWTFLPSRTTDKGSTRYDGPSLPTSRKSSVIRSNTKRLAIMVDGVETGTRERDLAGNVADVLRLTMAELKSLVGDFTPANYGQPFTSPTNGVTFTLVLREDAADEPEDTEDETED